VSCKTNKIVFKKTAGTSGIETEDNMSKNLFLVLSFLFTAPAFLSAKTAVKMDAILETPVIIRAQAAWFVLTAVNKVPPEAPIQDAIGFAASGLFEGFRLKVDLPSGSIAAGLWYTGLLHKETAEIMMTAADVEHYAEPWNLDNPGGLFCFPAGDGVRWYIYHLFSKV
jgi:hypothetical protein